MSYISLSSCPKLRDKSLVELETLFVHHDLDDGSFQVAEVKFSDGSSFKAFFFPTDFTLVQASHFLDQVSSTLS